MMVDPPDPLTLSSWPTLTLWAGCGGRACASLGGQTERSTCRTAQHTTFLAQKFKHFIAFELAEGKNPY